MKYEKDFQARKGEKVIVDTLFILRNVFYWYNLLLKAMVARELKAQTELKSEVSAHKGGRSVNFCWASLVSVASEFLFSHFLFFVTFRFQMLGIVGR